jgi:hypothetical protein
MRLRNRLLLSPVLPGIAIGSIPPAVLGIPFLVGKFTIQPQEMLNPKATPFDWSDALSWTLFRGVTYTALGTLLVFVVFIIIIGSIGGLQVLFKKIRKSMARRALSNLTREEKDLLGEEKLEHLKEVARNGGY